MQTPTNNSECDLALLWNRLDTLTAIVRVMHTQLNETVSELSETKRNLLEAKKAVNRLTIGLAECNAKNKVLEDRIIAIDVLLEDVMEYNHTVPPSKLNIKEDGPEAIVDILEYDAKMKSEDNMDVLREVPLIDMINTPCIQRLKNMTTGTGIVGEKILVFKPMFFQLMQDQVYRADEEDMYIYGIGDVFCSKVAMVNHKNPSVDWTRLIEFTNLNILHIRGDAFYGFAMNASSNTIKTLVFEDIIHTLNKFHVTVGKSKLNCHANNIDLSGFKEEPGPYTNLSYDWLSRFPNLETLDLGSCTKDGVLQNIVDFLPHCPSMRSIRGIGYRYSIQLVRYCRVNGIALKDK